MKHLQRLACYLGYAATGISIITVVAMLIATAIGRAPLEIMMLLMIFMLSLSTTAVSNLILSIRLEPVRVERDPYEDVDVSRVIPMRRHPPQE